MMIIPNIWENKSHVEVTTNQPMTVSPHESFITPEGQLPWALRQAWQSRSSAAAEALSESESLGVRLVKGFKGIEWWSNESNGDEKVVKITIYIDVMVIK